MDVMINKERLHANKADILKHLERLFERAAIDHPDAYIQIDIGDPEGKRPWSWEYFKITNREAAADFAVQKNADSNIYVGVNPRSPDIFPGAAATDADILCAYVNFTDHDTQQSIDNLKSSPLPHTFSVTTGKTPNTRAHCYWEREDPAINLKAWSDIQTGMADFFGSDRVIDPRRIMRLAGTVSYPSPKKIERGYVAELVTIRTEYDDERAPCGAVELYNAFPVLMSGESGVGGAVGNGLNLATYKNVPVDELTTSIMDGEGEWHNKMIRVVAHWVSRGLTDSEIILMARNFTQPGYTDSDTEREVLKATQGARAKWGVEAPDQVVERVAAEYNKNVITATPMSLDDLDPKNIDPREFIYGRHLIESYVAATISPGGTGKTTLVMIDAAAIAVGRKLTHDDVHRQGKVWHYNLEDPKDELIRRMLAIQQYFKLPKESIAGNVFLDSGRDTKMIVAERDGRGGIIATPHVDQLCEQIIQNDIKVLSVDPFIKSHFAEENDNKQMDDVLNIFGQIAHDTGCAIDLVHHVRKPPNGSVAAAGDINQARGASALSGAVRSARTLTGMTEKEAEIFGIKLDRKYWYVRIDDAKASMSPPSQGAQWMKRQSQDIGNAKQFSESDNVGVMEPWEPPDAFDGVTNETAREVLLTIHKQFEDGSRWSVQARAKHYVGYLIKESFLNKTEIDAKNIIKTWLASGVLVEEIYENENRKQRKCVTVDLEKLPTVAN